MSKKQWRTHKDLDVWNNSMEFVENIYLLTEKMPKDEKFGLVSQIRRSAISIPSNIAEGAARNSHKEFIQFLYISLGSLAEVETYLLIAQRLNITEETSLLDDLDVIRKMLLGLIKFLKANTARNR